MAHLRWCSHGAPGNQGTRIREEIKMNGPPGTVRSPRTWSPELLGPGEGTKRRACFGQFPCRATWILSNVDWESTGHRELGQTQCGKYTSSTPHTRQWCLFAVFFPPHNTTEQVSLNKWPPLPPCVRVEIRHSRHLQTEEAKINKRGNHTGSDRSNRLKPCS